MPTIDFMTTNARPPRLSIDGAVATITLRRPQAGNRLEVDDLALLREQIGEVNRCEDVRVLRFAGDGRHFCTGFNVGQIDGPETGRRFEALVDTVEQARPVTIAALHGTVAGGATDLALACDFRLGAPDCQMFVPAARLGLLFYRGGLERYVSRLGLAVAKRLLLAGETFDAASMHGCGYLDRLLPSVEALQPAVDELTDTLSRMAPLALLGMKKHLNRIARGTLDADEIARDIAAADASEDLREGVLARQEKRPAVFRGR
jgi:enoyl-CoA hydratase/carnithine racemase